MTFPSSPAIGPAARTQNLPPFINSDINPSDFENPQGGPSRVTAASSPIPGALPPATSSSSMAARELNGAVLRRKDDPNESERQHQTRSNTRTGGSYGGYSSYSSGGSAHGDGCCVCCCGSGGGGGGCDADCGEAGPYVCLGVVALTVGVVATGAISGGASYAGGRVVQEWSDNKLGRAGAGGVAGAGTTAVCAQIAKAIAIGTGNPGAAGLAYGVAWGVGLLSSACGIGLQLQEPPRHLAPLVSVVVEGAGLAAEHSLRNGDLPR